MSEPTVVDDRQATGPDGLVGSSWSSPVKKRRIRAIVISALIVLTLWAIYSLTSLFWAVQGVRSDTDSAVSSVTSGDFSAAQGAVASLAESSTELAGVTSSPAWTVVSALPILGESVRALHQMSTALADISTALNPIMESLASANGTAQRVAVVASSVEPLRNLAAAAVAAERDVNGIEPSSLLFGLGDQALALQEGLPSVAGAAVTVAEASEVLPSMLGMDGRRVWMVILQNPAESRGSGGLFSGYALVEFINGQPTILEANTRKKTLDDLDIPYRSVVDADSAALWGEYLQEWASFNISADFPTVARLAAAGMEARGTPVDGVIALDAYVVQALLAGTGPVEHRGVFIDGTNAGQFFTRDLYALYPDFPDVESKDQLALGLVYATIDSLLKRPLDFPTLLGTVPPIVDAGHVKVWSGNPAEEAWLRSIGLAGDIAGLNPGTSVVSFNNSTGSKLDAYVDPVVQYTVGTCQYTSGDLAGQRQSILTVQLTNNSPAGLPPYVDVRLDDPDAPPGSTKTLVQIYAPKDATYQVAYLNNSIPPFAQVREAGRPVWVAQTEMLRGQAITLSFVFAEPATSVPDPPVLVPGTAIPAEVSVLDVGSQVSCGEFPPTINEVAQFVAPDAPGQ